MISESNLTILIRKLKKNGYDVERDGSATVEGYAAGILKITYHDKTKKYRVIHEVDLIKVENVEEVIVEKFNL